MAFKMVVGDHGKVIERENWIALASKGGINGERKRRQDVKLSWGSDRPWTSLSPLGGGEIGGNG